MNADIWFSVGVIATSLVAVAVSVYLSLGVRGIPRSRVEVLVKILSAGRLRRADDTRDDWGYRLQSFGDLACAFTDVMNRGSAGQSHTQSRPGWGSSKRQRRPEAGSSLRSVQAR